MDDCMALYDDPLRKHEYYMTQLQVPVGVPYFSGSSIKQELPGTSKYLWKGRGGEVSAAHYDYYDNLYTVVKGQKELILVPPSSTRYLYATQHGSGEPGVDTIQTLVDFKQPDTMQYPLFTKAQRFSVTLVPGEILFIPSFWWHRIEAIGKTSAVSFWIQEVHSPPVKGTAPTPYLKIFDKLQSALDKEARFEHFKHPIVFSAKEKMERTEDSDDQDDDH